MKGAAGKRVSKKVGILRREGVPRRQAIATALNMERRHRLTSAGDYVRLKTGKRRRR